MSKKNESNFDALLAQFDAECEFAVSPNFHPDYEQVFKGLNFLMRDLFWKNRSSKYWDKEGKVFDQEAFNTMFYSFFGQLSEYKLSLTELETIASKRFNLTLEEVKAYYHKKIQFFDSLKFGNGSGSANANGNGNGNAKPQAETEYEYGDPPY